MKLGQITIHGRLTAVIVEGGTVRPIAGRTTRELIDESEAAGISLSAFAAKLAGDPIPAPALAIPLEPSEVWACGCTYQQSAAFRDAEHGTREGFYAYVFQSEHRPEVFFKGTARVCVGPNELIGIRVDSTFTAPEPELAVALDSQGHIVGYLLANDVSAWDIERENPLYLPQSKTFQGCCALGPVLVTADELRDPYHLSMTCEIHRAGATLFSGQTSTERLNRRLEVLVEYLRRANPVPGASVLMTGTGIIVTEEAALQAGDEVIIRVPELGELRNRAEVVS